jgi:hypothetical protein
LTLLLQDRAEIPEPPVIDVELREQERLLELLELVLRARVTVPVKPFTGVTVIFALPGLSAGTLTLDALVAIIKSWMVNVTFTEWERVPLVPVTVAR